jgi:hypothetical protein
MVDLPECGTTLPKIHLTAFSVFRILFANTATGSTSWKPPRKSKLSRQAGLDRPDIGSSRQPRAPAKDGVVLWKLHTDKKWNVRQPYVINL